MNPNFPQYRTAFSRHIRSRFNAVLVLILLTFGAPALAEIVNVEPNVADDIGNWSSTTVLGLEIRLNGFTGYTTTGVAADTIVDDKYRSGKVSHPQHVVRLPNAIGADGQWHAYFAITHSGDCDPTVDIPIFSGCSVDDMVGGDGYWMVAEIDADAYDHATDRIINSADSDGRYVYEEHFRRSNPRGDWNHPAAMAVMGDALLMVGQQFEPIVPLFKGDSPDALLFYDVSQPRAPAYVGKLDVCQLGLATTCTGESGQDVLDGLGLAHFENGWYHLYVGGGAGVVENFYCDSGADCFKDPVTIGPSGKWKDLPPSGETEGRSGGQQGNIIHSREIYSEAPGPGEPCYKKDGTLLGPNEKDASCSPSGMRRAIYSFAAHSTGTRYVQGSCWPYTSTCSMLTYNENPLFTKPLELVPGVGTLGDIANSLGVRNSADLNQFRRDAGIPFFDESFYQYTDPNDADNTGSVLSPGPDSVAYVGNSRIRKKSYFTQLSGECQSGNGTHVDENGEVLIYCVTESTFQQGGLLSTSQPRVCPENTLPAAAGGESCNILYENRPNGAPSYGVIRITEPGGKQLTYRGRGFRDPEDLNRPPWGPGRSICAEFNDPAKPQNGCKTWDVTSPLKDPNAVDWSVALQTVGTKIAVEKGEWAFNNQSNSYDFEVYTMTPSRVWEYGIEPQESFVYSIPPILSMRVLPERGIALFDRSHWGGRMLSAIRTVPNLLRYCGDDTELCSTLAVQTCTTSPGGLLNPLWYEDCSYPRTFDAKTSSARIRHSSWTIYFDPKLSGPKTDLDHTSFYQWNTGPNASGGGAIREMGRGTCSAPPKPTALSEATFPYGDKRPLVSWERLPGGGPRNNANMYNVHLVDADGAIIDNEFLPDPVPFDTNGVLLDYRETTKAYMPGLATGLVEGETYKWRVRGIDVQQNCYEEGPWSDYQSITILGGAVVVNLTPVTNDPLGLGGGTIEFAQGSDGPASDFGSNYYLNGSVLDLVATAAPDSEFVGWTGDAASCGVNTSCQITIDGNTNLQAVFRPKPRLLRAPQGVGTVTVNPSGIDCSNSNGWDCDIYATGTVVDMTAAAEPGQSNFLKWAGDSDCTDDDDADGNPLTSRVTMSEKKACTAIFTRSSYLLEATTATSGGAVSVSDSSGAVTCDPQGQICTKSYTAGIEQTATLTATADNGFRFVRWNGSDECWSPANGDGRNSSIDITVGTTDMYCRAVFVDENDVFTLNVQKTGTGSGASTVKAVVISPTPGDLPEINCALPACTTEVPSTATIQLTAIPVRGARFDGWYGSDPLCELPPIQVPDPDNLPFTIDSPDRNPVITVDMADVAALGGDLSCRANFSAKVLLVDGSDDDSLRSQYGSELNKLGQGDYDAWSVRSPNSTSNPEGREEPTAEDLANYSRVIWYTGAAFQAGDPNAGPIPAGPSPAAEAALGTYLDSGGCLMLSSAEYVGDRGLTPFATNYLGASAVNQDVDDADPNVRTEISGAGLLPGFSSFGTGRFTHPEGTATSDVAQRNDAIIPNTEPGTEVLYAYSAGASGVAGIGRDDGVYRSAFLGFPIMAMPTEDPTDIASVFDGRSEVIGTFLDYCLQIDKDDEFEANDDGEAGNIRSDIDDQRATRLQGNVNLTELKILPGNDDWYRWETTVQTDTKFEILFSHESGDLNFGIYEGNRRDPSDSMQSTDDNELREWTTGPNEPIFLRVYGVDGASNSYTLKITSEYIDTDSDGISNLADDDDDGDGMSDEFEIANGFDPLLSDNALFDSDDDGFNNLDEYLSGTDPRNSNSVPSPAPNLTPLNFTELCQPGAPRSLCGAISLPWLGILLGD